MDCRILIVDDEREMCVSLARILRSSGFAADFVVDPQKALPTLAKDHFDLVIMDIKMPRLSGLDLLQQLRANVGWLPVIMISGFPSVENIVASMKAGAHNFYPKPLDIPKLVEEIRELTRIGTGRAAAAAEIVTDNPKMQDILRQIHRVAETSAPVIITGESGTGKELVANAIHAQSSRRTQPFVKINCASIPDSLLESELFGYEPGAFTDARRVHRGKFEVAHKGSLLLDEIGDMSLDIQAKILRVLQHQEFERLGGASVIKTDVRVIAATNRDIPSLIDGRQFREDLFYRLSVVTIALPPLRERREDIVLLARYFLDQHCRTYGRCIEAIDPEVEELLLRHDWPGNIRELKNCIERAVIFSENRTLGLTDLPRHYEPPLHHAEEGLGKAHDQLTRQMILEALARCGGVKHKAADFLHIHRKTLYNQMKRLGIE